MLKLRAEIENPMLSDRGRVYNLTSRAMRRECECGCIAKFTINGKFRCYSCARDEGVELI